MLYPPYSSYRSDPLGTKAFYEGLGLLPGVEVGRNVEPLQNGPGLSGAAIFLFGIEETRFFAMDQASVKALEDAALEGGRVVMSFAPTNARPAATIKKRGKTRRPPRRMRIKGKTRKRSHTARNMTIFPSAGA